MLTRLTQWLAPPVFANDEDQTRLARLLNTVLLAFLAVAAVYGLAVPMFESNRAGHLTLSVLMLALMSALSILLRRGWLRLASLGIVGGLWLALTFIMFFSAGVNGTAFSGYMIPIICTNIFFGRRAAFGAAGLSAAAGLGWLLAHNAGGLPPPAISQTDASAWITQSLFFVSNAVLLSLANTSVDTASRQARQELAERWRAADQLRAGERRFRALIENISDVIALLDAEGKIGYVSPALEPTLGYAPQEGLGRNIFDDIHPDDQLAARATQARLLREPGSPVDFEFRLVDRTGSWRWVSGTAQNLLDDPGVAAIVVNFRDVTPRKQAEEALAGERDLLQALMDNIPDAIYFKDPASRFTRINPAQARVLGAASAEQALGRTDFDFQPADLAGAFYAEEQQILGTGQPLVDRLEYHPTPDRRPRWLSATKVPLRDRDGRIIGLVGISRDVTERQLAEERLRRREDLYRRAIMSADAVPYQLDYRAESYSFMGEGVFSLTGYTAEEMTPAIVNRITEAEQMRGENAGYTAAEAIQRVRSGRSLEWKCDSRIRTRAGETRWITDSSVQILDEGGAPAGAIGIMFDITERKQAEEALERAELQYRTLVEQTPAVVYSAEPGPGGRWLYVSPNVERMLGFTQPEWLADQGLWRRQLHPADRDQALALDARARATGQPFYAEYRFRTRDERIVWLRDEAIVLRDSVGQLLIMQGVLLDITERKWAEEALREAEARYRELVERIPAVVYSSQPGPAGRWRYVSPQIEKLVGYTPAEWMNDPDLWYASIHPDDRQAVIETEAAALAVGGPPQMEYRLATRAGGEVWVRDESTRAPRQPDGQTLVQGFLLDITDRKQAELIGRRQLQELKFLHAVATSIAAAGTEDELIERLTVVIGSTFYPTDFGVLLLDETPGSLRVHPSYHGAGRPYVARVPFGQGIVSLVAESGQPRRVADVRQDPYYHAAVSRTRSELCVPIKLGDRVLGVINTENERPEAFSESDERLLLTIAGQLATALERLRAEAALRITAARMEILHAIDTALLSAQSPAAIAQSAADKVRQLVDCRRVSVTLFDLPAGEVRFLAVSSIVSGYLPANSVVSVADFGPYIVEALQQGRPNVVDDVLQLPEAAETDRQHAREGIRAWVDVPLVYQGALIGALNIGSAGPGAVNAATIDIAREVADQLAIALQQARLNSDVAEALVREQRLNSVAQTISGVLDLPALLANIVRLAAELVGAESGSLNLAGPGKEEITDVYAFNVPPGLGGQTLARGQGLAWQVFEKGQSVLLNDYGAHPRALPEWVAAGLRRYIGVPVIAGDTRLGALGLYQLGQQRPFVERDLAIAESVGRQAGVAIQNARLVAALEQELAVRRRAEQALVEGEQTLRALLNASTDTEFLIDTRGTFLALNETLARSMGATVTALVGTTAYDLLSPQLAAARRARIEEAVQARQAIRFEDQNSRGWFDNSVVPVFDDRGQVAKLAIFARDITEQKQADAALRHRDAILEAVAFAAQQFLKTPDWQSGIQAVLAQLGQGTGASHVYIFENHLASDETLVTSQRFEWAAPGVPPDIDKPAFQEVPIWEDEFWRWAETLSRGEPFYGSLSTFSPTEAAYLVPRGVKSLLDVPIFVDAVWWGIIGFDDFAGERNWSVAEVDALKVAASTLAAAIQRQRADEQIRRLNADLERRVTERTAALEAANKELEAFSYSVSHDLRAPLRSIDGFSQALLEDYRDRLDGEGRRYLQIVRRETQRMGYLIDDLLGLSRVTRRDLRRTRVDLSALAHELIAVMRQREPERLVEVTIAPELTVTGDLNLLGILLDNLLGNAWKFTGRVAQARIEVGVQRQAGQAAYFVRDNGAGFDMLYAGKLFGVFQRLHSVTDFEGTGVGLATVERIVQRHGGRVWAEGAVDQGATFYFTLPD